LALFLELTDQRYCEIVTTLGGHPLLQGFAQRTPLLWCQRWNVFCKDETNHVAQSHKARHLMNVLLYYKVLHETADKSDNNCNNNNKRTTPRLAVASCGNAGLAAATLAAAVQWDIDVCIPKQDDDDKDDEDSIRLPFDNLNSPHVHVVPCDRSFAPVQTANGSKITPSRRDAADPTVAVVRQLVRRHGAWPLTVQGPDCGLAVEGGQTMAWEILEQIMASSSNKQPQCNKNISKLFLQIGGGALGAALCQGWERADQLRAAGILSASDASFHKPPAVVAVQAAGAAPLVRAVRRMRHDGVSIRDVCRGQRQSRYMFPWDHPSSVAHGILDDITYDWVELVRAMEATEGDAITVTEDDIIRANQVAKSELKVNACLTGSVGLAGLLSMARNNNKNENCDDGRQLPSGPSICILSGQDRRRSSSTAAGQRRTCRHGGVDGISYCILENNFDFERLLSFNQQHGSSPMNFIPEEPVRDHLSKLASGATKVWAAFISTERDQQEELVGFISAENGSQYWLETTAATATAEIEEEGNGGATKNDNNVCSFVHEFVVRADFRGRRVGGTLASLTVDPNFGVFSLDPTTREIYTTVHAANLASRSAFLKAGYHEVLTYNDKVVRNRNTTVLKFSKQADCCSCRCSATTNHAPLRHHHHPRGNTQRMRVVGVQSGNAVDGIDVGIFDFEPVVRSPDDPRRLAEPIQYTTVANRTFPFTDQERKYILSLRAMRLEDGNGYAEGNYKIGEWCADRIEQLIRETDGVDKSSIALIGSHGQTVSGHPHWELGDVSVIAQRTGITVVGDFRPADVAAGGNGTPCTCTYDSIMLRPKKGEMWRICINIGGTSSVTFCPPWSSSSSSSPEIVPRGLDPGLGVFFMDLMAEAIDPSLSYDVDGRLARSGNINEDLLAYFLSYRYYQQTELPIGVGPDDFPETLWAAWRTKAHADGITDIDIMATLTELTARQIAIACSKFGGLHVRNGKTNDVVLRGGVCNNLYFVERLHWNLEQQLQVQIAKIKTLEDLGIDSESWENALYAMMGYLCFNNVYNFVPSCTGASRPVVGGRIAPGHNFHSVSLVGTPM